MNLKMLVFVYIKNTVTPLAYLKIFQKSYITLNDKPTVRYHHHLSKHQADNISNKLANLAQHLVAQELC